VAKHENAVVSSVDFVKVFIPAVKAGRSALEIGRQLGFKGADDKVSLMVSAKASQLRKKLEGVAIAQAKQRGLNETDTTALVAETTGKIPRIKGSGRPKKGTAELVSAIDSILLEMDSPTDEYDAENLTDNMAEPVE
jgi:hypothetical protein